MVIIMIIKLAIKVIKHSYQSKEVEEGQRKTQIIIINDKLKHDK